MPEALVIAGIVAAPLGSAALFLPPAPVRGTEDAGRAWPAIRRFVLAVAGTVLLAFAAGRCSSSSTPRAAISRRVSPAWPRRPLTRLYAIFSVRWGGHSNGRIATT